MILHSTRGGQATDDLELEATLNWFSNPESNASAHAVIDRQGIIYDVVRSDNIAWHARDLNWSYLGVELIQATIHSPITDEQYQSLAWWIRKQALRYGFGLSGETLIEHRLTATGIAAGKSDLGYQFLLDRLLAMI